MDTEQKEHVARLLALLGVLLDEGEKVFHEMDGLEIQRKIRYDLGIDAQLQIDQEDKLMADLIYLRQQRKEEEEKAVAAIIAKDY